MVEYGETTCYSPIPLLETALNRLATYPIKKAPIKGLLFYEMTHAMYVEVLTKQHW